jgi:hypothetical protein
MHYSLAVAGHEALHLTGMIAGSSRVAGTGPQRYAAFPGEMIVTPTTPCEDNCEINALIAAAIPLLP